MLAGDAHAGALSRMSDDQRDLLMRPSELLGPKSTPSLDGISAAVYGLVLPETRATVTRLWSEQPHVLFECAYEDTQDTAHVAFLDAWRDWVSPPVTGLTALPHRYVTNGSSEALRESIWTLARLGHGSTRVPQLHV